MNNSDIYQAVRTICETYLGGSAENIVDSHGGNHDVYIIDYKDERFVLKTPRKGNTTWVSKQLSIEKWLRDQGIPVPPILAHGNPSDGMPVPWILMKYGGRSLNQPHHEWERMVVESGAILARIHGVVFDGPGWFRNGRLEPADHLASRKTWSANDLAWCVEESLLTPDEIEKTHCALERVARNSLATLCHGDFTLANVLVREGRISYVIDWDDLLADDPLNDLARLEMVALYWGWDFGLARRGYTREGNSLEQYDEQRAPLIVQHLLSDMCGCRSHDENGRYRSVLRAMLGQ